MLRHLEGRSNPSVCMHSGISTPKRLHAQVSRTQASACSSITQASTCSGITSLSNILNPSHQPIKARPNHLHGHRAGEGAPGTHKSQPTALNGFFRSGSRLAANSFFCVAPLPCLLASDHPEECAHCDCARLVLARSAFQIGDWRWT